MQYARPLTSPTRPIVTVGRSPLGCGCAARATGAFELPSIAWGQVGVAVALGLGLGYVLFATK